MAASIVQFAKGTSTSAVTSGIGFASAPASGNVIVLGFSADDYNGTPDSGWTQSAEMEQQGFLGHYLWHRVSDGGNSFQYTIGSGTNSAWVLLEIAGLDTGDLVDDSQGAVTNSFATTYTTPNITPSTGDRLLLALLGKSTTANDQSPDWTGWTNSFTHIASSGPASASGSYNACSFAYREVTGDGSTAYNTNAGNGTGGDAFAGEIISFKIAAGGSIEEGAGSAAGTGAVSGIGAATATAAGSVGGASTASAVGASTAEGVGAAACSATTAGIGASTVECAGAAAGTSTVAGVGSTASIVASGAGSAAGASTGTSTATAIKATAGTVSGAGVAAGSGASTAVAAGAASGTATVSGVGSTGANYQAGAGSATGTSTATAVGTRKRPDSTNTGYQNEPSYPGSLTTYSGADPITTPNQTFEYIDFPDGVTIESDGHTFRGCRFGSNWVGGWNVKIDVAGASTGILFTYCSWETKGVSAPPVVEWPSAGLDGGWTDTDDESYMIPNADSYQYGILHARGIYTVDHCDMWGWANAVQLNSGGSEPVVFQHSWFHDAKADGGGGAHQDGIGVLTPGGYSNLTVDNCVVASIANTNGIALQGGSTPVYDNLVFTDNYFSGFGYLLQLGSAGIGDNTNMVFTGNVVATDIGWIFGPLFDDFSPDYSTATWHDNKFRVYPGSSPRSGSLFAFDAGDDGKYIHPDGTLSATDWGADGAGVGSAAGASTANATGSSTAEASGASDGAATATGDLAVTTEAAGSAAGSATVAGQGFGVSEDAGTGVAAGISSATAVGAATNAIDGLSSGSATAAAEGVAFAAADGASAGSATAQAGASQVLAGAGVATGGSSVAGSLASFWAALGAASGTSIAIGALSAEANMAGFSSGTSSSAAVAPAEALPPFVIERVAGRALLTSYLEGKARGIDRLTGKGA